MFAVNLKDPFLWMLLVLQVALHVPGSQDPPLNDHAWRQTDTAAVARNFQEEDANILYPRVDARGEHSGITGMEFPLFNAVIAGANRVLGFSHARGRLVATAFSLLALVYLYLLVSALHGRAAARFAASSLLAAPLFFFNARQIQPDVVMVSFSVAALFHAHAHAVGGHRSHLWLAAAWMGLALLVKATVVFVGLPLLWVLWSHRRLTLEAMLAGVMLAVLPAAAWYLHSRGLSRDHGLEGHFNLTENPAVLLTPSYWLHVFVLRVPSSVATLPAAAVALVGLRHVVKMRAWLWLVWLGALVLFQLVFAEKTYAHVYYSLALCVPLAALAGLGWEQVVKSARTPVACGVLGLMLVVTAVRVHGWYALHHTEYLALEALMETHVPPQARVVVNGGPSPAMVYFSHRKGWTADNNVLTPAYLAEKAQRGAQFLVLAQRDQEAPLPSAPPASCVVHQGADFTVHRLAGCP